jgi:membrane associated rhomboid family serine protease
MNTTTLLLLFTTAISILANNSASLKEKMLFKPFRINKNLEWHRFFSSGFIHADWEHLIFNMLSLYLFGTIVEQAFQSAIYFAKNGTAFYILLYTTSIPISLLYTYFRNKSKSNYASLGASGAVSAVIFSAILIDPTIQIGLFLIPPIIPGYLFGPLFLIAAAWMGKKGKDNINHAAHIAGALYGWIFTITATYIEHDNLKPIHTFISIVQKNLGLE